MTLAYAPYFKYTVGQPHSLCVDTKGRSNAFKISFFMLTDPVIPMNSIAFYHRSDQRKGKMKPPPNPFTQVQAEYFKANTHDNWIFHEDTQVQNIFTNTHKCKIFSQIHTGEEYFNKHTQLLNIFTR